MGQKEVDRGILFAAFAILPKPSLVTAQPGDCGLAAIGMLLVRPAAFAATLRTKMLGLDELLAEVPCSIVRYQRCGIYFGIA